MRPGGPPKPLFCVSQRVEAEQEGARVRCMLGAASGEAGRLAACLEDAERWRREAEVGTERHGEGWTATEGA